MNDLENLSRILYGFIHLSKGVYEMIFGSMTGTWTITSASDPRWNMSGSGFVGGFECPMDAEAAIEQNENILRNNFVYNYRAHCHGNRCVFVCGLWVHTSQKRATRKILP